MASSRKPGDMKGAAESAPRRKARSSLELSEAHYDWNHRDSGEPLIYDYIDSFDSWADYLDDECHDKEYEQERVIEKSRRIIEAFRRYLDHEVSTLDEAFAVGRPKGYRRNAAEIEVKKKRMVQRDVLQFVQAGVVIDEALFAVVGKIHGIGKTQVGEWWGARKHKIPRERLRKTKLPKEFEIYRNEITWL